MNLLLDSHVSLWWLDGNVALGAACRAQITTADVVFFSAVTPWELGIKRALGKLVMPDGLVGALVDSGFVPMPITAQHAEFAPSLPPHHKDPFDRMLIAQAQLESLALVTADSAIEPYGIPLINARL